MKRDRRNCCPYSEKLVPNFVRHLIRIHKSEDEVKKIISIIDDDDKQIQKRKRTFISNKLRNKGNYAYDLKLVEKNSNEH